MRFNKTLQRTINRKNTSTSMKFIKLLILALLFVACGSKETAETQQKKLEKVAATKGTVKKSPVVAETKTTVTEAKPTVAETKTAVAKPAIDVPVKENQRKNVMRNENEVVEQTTTEETTASNEVVSVLNVVEESTYNQEIKVVVQEDETKPEVMEVSAPANQTTIVVPEEQPIVNKASEVLDKPQVADLFSHSLRASIGVYKFWSKETYYKPIPSVELGYMCVFEPNDKFYTEIGANLMFAYGNISKEKLMDSDVLVRASLLSVSIPFNFGYNIRIKKDWSLSPYIGVYQRIYIWGNTNTIVAVDDKVVQTKNDLFAAGKNSANWHQIGMHAGIKLNHKKCSYGAVFGYDFLEFDKSKNVMTWGLNFGYTF